MALLFHFERVNPRTDVLRSSAETAGVSFDYNAILSVSNDYSGYSDANEADISQTEIDALMNQIESDTGQTITGPYTKDEAIEQAYGDVSRR